MGLEWPLIVAPKPHVSASSNCHLHNASFEALSSSRLLKGSRREQIVQCHATGSGSLDKLGRNEDAAAPTADLQRKKVR